MHLLPGRPSSSPLRRFRTWFSRIVPYGFLARLLLPHQCHSLCTKCGFSCSIEFEHLLIHRRLSYNPSRFFGAAPAATLRVQDGGRAEVGTLGAKWRKSFTHANQTRAVPRSFGNGRHPVRHPGVPARVLLGLAAVQGAVAGHQSLGPYGQRTLHRHGALCARPFREDGAASTRCDRRPAAHDHAHHRDRRAREVSTHARRDRRWPYCRRYLRHVPPREDGRRCGGEAHPVAKRLPDT